MSHLRSITMKGFKSFPQRTTLEFAPGVGVVVGPNGSGKSNVTDAVLWALGEQSPLAVRGQTMQDVIFAGGHGLKSSRAAEVEVVVDNSDGVLDSEFSELSIMRRLDRSGEGEYRLNGARCRLVDVIEALSDTGLGKEAHSIVSQGRVETIIHSRPRDRRLLIEEAAGLGKHRKRRRRAQLKLERTQENLDRALDVEREARSRLKPLKRQAEAAELHARLERQSLEARLALAAEAARVERERLAGAESAAAAARTERDAAEELLAGVAGRREAAEQAVAAQGSEREALQTRSFAARSAAERIALRLERAREEGAAAADGAERRGKRLAELGRQATEEEPDDASARVVALEQELATLDAARDDRVRDELAALDKDREQAAARRVEADAAADKLRAALDEAQGAADAAREGRVEAERAAEVARQAAAEAGAELATVERFLSAAASAPEGARSLADDLGVEPGYETALAAALGPRLRAGVVPDVSAGEKLLDGAGEDGAVALVAAVPATSGAGSSGATGRAEGAPASTPPTAGAERLLDRVSPAEDVARLAERLLADVWVVEALAGLTDSFAGVAVTRAGRILFAATGELRQAAAGGEQRLLEQRNRRGELAAAVEVAKGAEAEARAQVERAGKELADADTGREEAEVALRRALRDAAGAADEVSRLEWLLERRREAREGEGPEAVRRAELAGELRSERERSERVERERTQRDQLIERLRAGITACEQLAAAAARAATALAAAAEAVEARAAALASELEAGEAASAETAAELRRCAHEEAELQARLKRGSDAVTTAEVAAQQARDATAEVEAELREVAGALGLEAEPAAEPLDDEQREALEAKIERLARRREQLGPVNPLAKAEYDEAIAHVEELEEQRNDLESALSELRKLIRETDRRIRESFEETFAAAARNFEEVVGHLFPGGRGRLRLVQPDGPRAVIGGASKDDGEQAEEAGTDAGAEAGAEAEEAPSPEDPGVEVEVTPAGKSTKRLSLLSGGEKSLVALAFMFAVFLARPCPFYILDEVEAALDDINIDRFLQLVRRYSDRAQFIVVTHQKRTMDAADRLYGVSMGDDGVSRVVSRKLSAVADESSAA